MTGHDLGRATEARFVMDASRRGLKVSRPFTDLPGYDAVVDTGKRLVRVSVKGARLSRGSPGHAPRYRINIARRGSRSSLDFDVLAVFLESYARWVFFPKKGRKWGPLFTLGPTGGIIKNAPSWEIFNRYT